MTDRIDANHANAIRASLTEAQTRNTDLVERATGLLEDLNQYNAWLREQPIAEALPAYQPDQLESLSVIAQIGQSKLYWLSNYGRLLADLIGDDTDGVEDGTQHNSRQDRQVEGDGGATGNA